MSGSSAILLLFCWKGVKVKKSFVFWLINSSGGSEEHINTYEDIETFRKATNASSVMIARTAQFNCSIFRKEGLLPMDQVIHDYLKIAIKYDNHYINCKYCILEMMKNCQETEKGQKLRSAVCLEEICEVFDLKDYLDEVETKRKAIEDARKGEEPASKKVKQDNNIVAMDFIMKRCDFDVKAKSPKSILLEWTRMKRIKEPVYETVCRDGDRRFLSVLSVDGIKYQTTYWQRNKRLAEQSAAVVCLRSLGLHDGRKTNNDSLNSSKT